MLKTILTAGVAAAGGFAIANYAGKYMAKEGTTFDDKLSPENKELLRQGIAAGTGVGLFAVLSRF